MQIRHEDLQMSRGLALFFKLPLRMWPPWHWLGGRKLEVKKMECDIKSPFSYLCSPNLPNTHGLLCHPWWRVMGISIGGEKKAAERSQTAE